MTNAKNTLDIHAAYASAHHTAPVTTITPTTGTTIAQDATEGAAIAKLIKARRAKGIKAFAVDTGVDGMDTRLGALLLKLMSESSSKSGFATKIQLKTNNLDKIDRRDRSDAIWFATNREEANAFNIDSGSRFTTISTLQQAMTKASKLAAKEAAQTETDATDSDSDSDGAETDTDDSVIGGVDTDKTCYNEKDLAQFMMGYAASNNLNVAKIMVEIDAIRVALAQSNANKAAQYQQALVKHSMRIVWGAILIPTN